MQEKPRVITCAAIKLFDGTIIAGPRHFDCIMRQQVGLIVSVDYHHFEQGFLDQSGVFLSRTEAWKVAFAAGQVKFCVGGDTANGGTLYSENLY